MSCFLNYQYGSIYFNILWDLFILVPQICQVLFLCFQCKFALTAISQQKHRITSFYNLTPTDVANDSPHINQIWHDFLFKPFKTVWQQNHFSKTQCSRTQVDWNIFSGVLYVYIHWFINRMCVVYYLNAFRIASITNTRITYHFRNLKPWIPTMRFPCMSTFNRLPYFVSNHKPLKYKVNE